MFSASLISMLVHSAGPSVLPEGPSDVASVETDVGKLASRLAYAMFPWDIPVVLRTDDYISLNDILDPNFQLRRIETSPGGPLFVWGRVEAERLARFFAERYAISVRREYVDLGTPLAPASGMSASLWQECHNLFGQTRAGHAPEITVAFIDRGDAHSGPPADFGGRVTHLNSNNVELSPHALQVLWVLLDRLAQLGILHRCEIVCSLVEAPAQRIGMRWFESDNATELLSAVQQLRSYTAGSTRPVLTTISLGTHVGPHNGESPLEQAISANAGAHDYLFAAAGNDGMRGLSSRIHLQAGVPDAISLRTGPDPGNQLLVEFWWREQNGRSVSLEVQLRDAAPPSADWFTFPLRIDATRFGTALQTALPAFNGIALSSLFHVRAHNDMCCVTLAITASIRLPDIDVECTFVSPDDVVINGWIVVGGDKGTHFMVGAGGGSVRVPSTAPDAVCVSGVIAGGQPWSQSSRGPAGEYGPASVSGPPHLGHRVEHGHSNEKGTSFASPRACADAADILLDPQRRSNVNSAADLTQALLGWPAGTPWNPRTGFGAITS